MRPGRCQPSGRAVRELWARAAPLLSCARHPRHATMHLTHAHAVAQVERLQRRVRDPRAGYFQTLDVLRAAKACGVYTKSSIMLGLGEGGGRRGAGRSLVRGGGSGGSTRGEVRAGSRLRLHSLPPHPARPHPPAPCHQTPGETDDEIIDTMFDLRDAGVDILTLGQYLQPTPHHLEVAEYVTPDKFEHWCAGRGVRAPWARRAGIAQASWGCWGRLAAAEGLRRTAATDACLCPPPPRRVYSEQTVGFRYVASGPLVRSSYRAGEFFTEAMVKADRAAAAVEVGGTRVPLPEF